MRKLIYYLAIGLFLVGCGSTTKTTTDDTQLPEGAVRIANDDLEYEIIIIDPGFETYLYTIAKPANYYSQSYYETKNKFYVTEWNIRATNPLRYNSKIYENVIDYDFNVDYGLDVNYKLYNYFKFVEHNYGQKF
ncbi:hypothetical protein BX611_2270 [Lutibacter oceani]|uniref:Lipoprotein n=1 Tax=Lutibacter oceani TaxID=1853311 RepID=A0A3D9RSC0_9FLAO|nr:DUF6146 family protein [Lutibacter oceani]REE80621.1 hypothetical protein BX611_2270 [Lutibacter oceani]